SPSSTLRALVGSSKTNRVVLFPETGKDCTAMIFTLRSDSARQILPSVPGLSSNVRINSLAVGILLKLLSISIGCRVGHILGWIMEWEGNHTPRLPLLQEWFSTVFQQL